MNSKHFYKRRQLWRNHVLNVQLATRLLHRRSQIFDHSLYASGLRHLWKNEQGAYLMPGIFFLLFTTLVVLGLGREMFYVDVKQQRAEIAADAAARAGAVAYRDAFIATFEGGCGETAQDVSKRIGSAMNQSIAAQIGRYEAASYAAQNRATLLGYSISQSGETMTLNGVTFPLPLVSVRAGLTHQVLGAGTGEQCASNPTGCYGPERMIEAVAAATIVPVPRKSELTRHVCTTDSGEESEKVDIVLGWEVKLRR